MEAVGEEILRHILLKLPTRDVARCRCISRLWFILLRDPSFLRLHGKAAHVVSGSGGGGAAAETLLITNIVDDLRGLEMTVRNTSVAKPLCLVIDLARSYGPANACNGFILFESCSDGWPNVCNPITGEKLKIPPPPDIKSIMREHSYAMGFSPSTCQYKLFWLFFFCGRQDSYIHVCTLGDGGGWRRHPYPFRPTSDTLSPVLIDGKLYVVTQHPRGVPERILVIDVASEAHCTYLLPEFKGKKVFVHAFDLDGRLCIAERVLDDRRLYFWVMPPLQGLGSMDRKNDTKLGWELLYRFKMDKDDGYGDLDYLGGVWLNNDDRMLCYRQGNRLYKYNTSTEEKSVPGCLSKWDCRIWLPEETPLPYRGSDQRQWWNIYGGYRPTLLSPRLAFASVPLPQHHHDEEDRYDHALLHAFQCKKRFYPCPPHGDGDQRASKRIRDTKPTIRKHNKKRNLRA
jgi:F-box interacting protein